MFRLIPFCFIAIALFNLTKPTPYVRQIDLAKLHPRHKAYLAPIESNLVQTSFNTAPEIGDFIHALKRDFDVDVVVETGTFRGDTTRFFSNCFDQVHTIEFSKTYFESAQQDLSDCKNIHFHWGSSEKVLGELLPKLKNQKSLFYLDAHWNDYCPLLDELSAIAETHKDNCIIVIDDFKVPHRNDCHYDQYGNVKCTYKCIRNHLDKLFSAYEYYYLIPKNPMARAKFIAIPKSWPMKKGAICQRKFEVASDLLKRI